MTEAIYEAGTIKRDRRTKSRVDQLDRQIMDVVGEDHPQSVRHIFYHMTNPRLQEPIEKSDRGYRHVQHRIVELRRSGRLPYAWITDATRRGYFTQTFSDASNFLKRMVGLYRADLWSKSTWYCEVWAESRSIASVIQDDCEELAVSLYPTGGFSSISLPFQAAEFINEAARSKRVCILYVGDYDPAGVLIDVAVERELRKHLDPNIPFYFHRVGITEEQIARFDLPTKPRKDTDRRAHHVGVSVEAEAMPAHILREMLRDCIEKLLPADALAVARVAENRNAPISIRSHH